MLKQHQEQASTSTYCCSHLALRYSQPACLHQLAAPESPGYCKPISMCDSLGGASKIYMNSKYRRQGWDGRVYYHPALMNSASTRLRHSRDALGSHKRSPAKCCGCWVQKSSGAAERCMHHSTEELELVSLLQVLLSSAPALHCVHVCCVLNSIMLPTNVCCTLAVSMLHV